MKPSEMYNIPYLLEIISKDDPFYEYLQDTDKLDSLSDNDFSTLSVSKISDIKPEDIFTPAGLEVWRELWNSYEFSEAYIIDNDTIAIDNGTGFLFNVEGLVITRNGKKYDNQYLKDAELFKGLDGETISIYEKVEGYDNVWRWWSGT